MAGRVTALRYQKRDTARVNVYIEEKFAFGLPDVDAARLRVGQYLSDEEIEGLQGADEEQRAYERAVRFLSYRPRSEAEVRQNLAQARLPAELIDRVVTRLQAQGYLNDAEFARFWIENRERFRPRGARALQEELRRKGVDAETSGELLADIDAGASAYRAAQPRAVKLAPLLNQDRLAFRRRLEEFLVRRGFSYEVTREVVGKLERELSEEPGDIPESDE